MKTQKSKSKPTTATSPKQRAAVRVHPLVRLMEHWDKEVIEWEEASEHSYSQGEKAVSMRCSSRAYEIAKCRRELAEAIKSNGVSDPALKTHEFHEKRNGRVRSNPWFERPVNDLQTIGK